MSVQWVAKVLWEKVGMNFCFISGPKLAWDKKHVKERLFFLPEVSKIPKVFEISVETDSSLFFRRGAFQLLSFISETQRSKLQRQRRRQYGAWSWLVLFYKRIALPQLKIVESANHFVSSETLNSKVCADGRRRRDDMYGIYGSVLYLLKKTREQAEIARIYSIKSGSLTFCNHLSKCWKQARCIWTPHEKDLFAFKQQSMQTGENSNRRNWFQKHLELLSHAFLKFK